MPRLYPSVVLNTQRLLVSMQQISGKSVETRLHKVSWDLGTYYKKGRSIGRSDREEKSMWTFYLCSRDQVGRRKD